MEDSKLTGIQKAALLLITLGPDASSSILKKFSEADVQKITYEIANISSVTTKETEEILNEVIEIKKAREFAVEGGIDYAKVILSKAFGSTKADDILQKVAQASEFNRPFALARKANYTQILNALSYEHPQTIALVLCYLQPEKSAKIISDLPENIQKDVAYRIATMNNTSPEIVREIEQVLDDKLSSIVRSDMAVLGGVDALVDILNEVDRNTEKNITESLEVEDEELAEKIKNCMFVFEDIITIDDSAIQRVLREIDNKELALALKGCTEDIVNAIFRNLSKKAAELLKEEIEFMGPVRLVEVEKAQQKVVSIIRQLDESGEIVLSRGVSDAVIM